MTHLFQAEFAGVLKAGMGMSESSDQRRKQGKKLSQQLQFSHLSVFSLYGEAKSEAQSGAGCSLALTEAMTAEPDAQGQTFHVIASFGPQLYKWLSQPPEFC